MLMGSANTTMQENDTTLDATALHAEECAGTSGPNGTGDDGSDTCDPAPADYLLQAAARPPPSSAVRQ